jgi:fatty-acyl-CoA synthase
MALGSNVYSVTHDGLLRIEDCLDADGGVLVPPGVTLVCRLRLWMRSINCG